MANPHNKARYGELWNQTTIDLYLEKFQHIKNHVIFSGGWAWHFMSPNGHLELKHAHDHKDVDIFVPKENVIKVIEILSEIGFKKVHTRFPAGEADFRRYEFFENGQKLIIDFFVGSPPCIEIDGYQVLEPNYLINLYGSIHSSKNCFAVVAASNLLKNGISPIKRNELIEIPK